MATRSIYGIDFGTKECCTFYEDESQNQFQFHFRNDYQNVKSFLNEVKKDAVLCGNFECRESRIFERLALCSKINCAMVKLRFYFNNNPATPSEVDAMRIFQEANRIEGHLNYLALDNPQVCAQSIAKI